MSSLLPAAFSLPSHGFHYSLEPVSVLFLSCSLSTTTTTTSTTKSIFNENQYFIQEVLLDWMEAGNADPATIILWTKSPQKVRIFADLLNIVNFPSLRITLLNLEDLKCPPLAQICPTTQLWSITQKAVRLAGSSSKVWLKNLTSRLYLGLHEHFFFPYNILLLRFRL